MTTDVIGAPYEDCRRLSLITSFVGKAHVSFLAFGFSVFASPDRAQREQPIGGLKQSVCHSLGVALL